MNFPPLVKAWLQLIFTILAGGLTVGYTAFLTGATVWGAVICGLGTGATNVLHALSSSPKETVEAKEAQLKDNP